MQVSFNPQNHPKPSTLVHRKLRFLLCRITIWFIILAFWHVVAQGYLQHGDVLRHQVGTGGDLRSSLFWIAPAGPTPRPNPQAQHPGFVQFE